MTLALAALLTFPIFVAEEVDTGVRLRITTVDGRTIEAEQPALNDGRRLNYRDAQGTGSISLDDVVRISRAGSAVSPAFAGRLRKPGRRQDAEQTQSKSTVTE